MAEKIVLIEIKEGEYISAIEKKFRNHYEYFPSRTKRVGKIVDYCETMNKLENFSLTPVKKGSNKIIKLEDKNYDEVLRSFEENS